MQASNLSSTTVTYIRAGLLGFVAGLRSQMPLAVLGNAARLGEFAADAEAPLSWFRSGWVQAGLALLAAGELVGDKLPVTPSRVSTPQLYGRLGLGVIAGGVVAHEAGESIVAGAAIGAVGAAAGSYGGYGYRTAAGGIGLPDILPALVEDGASIALGMWTAAWHAKR